MRPTPTSTSVTRSIAPFLLTWMSRPHCASCRSPARTTASIAVVRYSGRLDATRLHALHHPDLHPAFRRALQPHIVHEVADEEDAAAARLEEVLGRKRIRHLLGIEDLPLLPEGDATLRHG